MVLNFWFPDDPGIFQMKTDIRVDVIKMAFVFSLILKFSNDIQSVCVALTKRLTNISLKLLTY